MRWTFVAAVVGCLLVPSLGAGHEQTRFDPDDSDGPLDIAAARQRHRVLYEASLHPPRSRRVVEMRFRVATYEKWESTILKGNKDFIAVEFNFDNDAVIERCIVIVHGEFEPNVRLYRRCDYADDDLLRVLSGHRPDKRSLVVAVNRHQLKKGLRVFRWRVVTSFEDPDGEEGDPCWAGSFPSPGPYGVCMDVTKWRRHKFG